MFPKRANACDVLIIGAGIIGLSIAKELSRRYPELKITIIEKESALGKHASGRNSGVLHAGIYYAQDTLKARFCVEGAKEVFTYCLQNKLPLKKIGKIILPLKEEDDLILDDLYKRALANGVRVELINEERLRELEKEAFSITKRALFSPDTSIIDPISLLHQLERELNSRGMKIHYGEEAISVDARRQIVHTRKHTYSYGFLFNAAGLYADKIAHLCGVGKKYRILPFKGIYFELLKSSGILLNHLIYPTPDLRVPFLGVHFTPTFSGKTYIGPTAIPALGRENYRFLEGISLLDTLSILVGCANLFLENRHGFRQLVRNEMPHYFRTYVAREAKKMVPRVKKEHIIRSSKVGIRAQLYDVERKELVMDFLVERGEKSVHVLNAISPALTSSFPFARFIVENYFKAGGV